jgi:hypothetical protein
MEYRGISGTDHNFNPLTYTEKPWSVPYNSSDYYSPGNQVKRMEREREVKLGKQVSKERRAQSQRDYRKFVEQREKRNKEYREGRCRYYGSMSRNNTQSNYYRAKRREFCD